MKSSPSLASSEASVAVIGDVRGSRRAVNRKALHDKLTETLDTVNAQHPALDPFRITVGDEFQGRFAQLGPAVAALYAVHLSLHPDIEVRFGVGRGTAMTLDPTAGIHDGSAFWHARDAIEAVAASENGRTWRGRAMVIDPDIHPDVATATNAAISCVDQLIWQMDERDRRLLAGLHEGKTQAELAEAEGISASAVSQRTRRNGIGAVLASLDGLSALR